MIFIGADHAGFALKEKVKVFLEKEKYQVKDCGAFTFDAHDDYPDFIKQVAQGVSDDPKNARGIIIGGSGQAEMICANKFKRVRCALYYSPAVPTEPADIKGRKSSDPHEIIRLTREHNDANMLSLGARFLTEKDAFTAIKKWLDAPFPGDKRHVRRIQKIEQIEKELCNSHGSKPEGCCGGGCCS